MTNHPKTLKKATKV